MADSEHEGEPLPSPGLRQAVADSAGQRVAVIETTAVRVIGIGDVDLAHALGEGEGYRSVAEWRAGHEQFWHSPDMRTALDDPGFTVNDGTLVVAQAYSGCGGTDSTGSHTDLPHVAQSNRCDAGGRGGSPGLVQVTQRRS